MEGAGTGAAWSQRLDSHFRVFRAVHGEPCLGSMWGHCLPSGSMPSDSTGHLISGPLCFLSYTPQVTLDKQLSEHEYGLAHPTNGILNRRFTAGLPGQGHLSEKNS